MGSAQADVANDPARQAALGQFGQRSASGSPLDVIFQQFGQIEAQQILQILLDDISAGINPRQMASDLRGVLDDASYGRAATIARTETMTSWNDAALANYQANSDIIGSWMWVCMPGAGTCFPAGTLIDTARGKAPIEDVRVGEVVLTHTGQYRRVLACSRREHNGPMTTLRASGRSVTATSDHPFLLLDWQEQLDWVEAGDIPLGARVFCKVERAPYVNEQRITDRAVERRIRQAHDTVTSALQLKRLSRILSFGFRPSMPVGAINLERDVQRGQIEVHRIAPAGKRMLLQEVDSQLLETKASAAFWFRLANEMAIAAKRAKAALGCHGRLNAVFLAARQAGLDSRRTAARFRAILAVCSGFTRPAMRGSKDCSAALARYIDGLGSLALARAVGTGRFAGNGEEALATSPAYVLNVRQHTAARSRAHVLTAQPIMDRERLSAHNALLLETRARHLPSSSVRMGPLMGGVARSRAEATAATLHPGVGRGEGCAALNTNTFHAHIVTFSRTHRQTETVYNLEVEEDHSYIANGFVVHNCVSCLEEDGTIYNLDEELDDHPNGRCVKGPVTADYGSILSQYGIDAGEEDFGPGPWDDRLSGEEWLLAQDAETQRAAFGSNAAYNAWKVGDAKLSDFVKIRHDPVWGDSIQQQSLRGMGLKASDYGVGTAKAAEAAAKETLASKVEESPALTQMRASLDALDPNAIHPTTADKFGLDLRNTYRVEVDGQPYFVKAERAPMVLDGVRYDVGAQTMAADKSAQLMGMGEGVVPARFIENDAGRFIVQPWVGGTELSKLDDAALKEAFANMPAEDIQRQSLFDYLVGDSDRTASGYFLMPDGSIKAVDFGGAFDVSSPGLVNNFIQLAVPGKDFANVAIDRTVAEDLLSHVPETRAALEHYGLDDAQLKLFDEQAARLQAVLAEQEKPAFYDLLSDHTYYTAPDREALLTVGRPAEEVATKVPESPALQQLRADRSALQVQRDTIQAKQDVLSVRWAKIVRETDFTEPDEATAAEKKLAAIEKQQADNITKMDRLAAKMRVVDTQIKETLFAEASGKTPEELAELKATMTDLQKQQAALMQDRLKTEQSRDTAEYKLGSHGQLGLFGLYRDLDIATQRAMRDVQNQAFEEALAKAPTADDALSKAVVKAQAKYEDTTAAAKVARDSLQAAEARADEVGARVKWKQGPAPSYKSIRPWGPKTIPTDATDAQIQAWKDYRAATTVASKADDAAQKAYLGLIYATNDLQRAVFATVKEEDVAHVKSVVAVQKKIDVLEKKIDVANAHVEDLNVQMRDVSRQLHDTYLESRGGLLPYALGDARAPFSDTLDIPPPQTGRGGFPIQKPNDLMRALDYNNKIETDFESKVRISYDLGARLENNDAFLKMADELGRASTEQGYPLTYGAVVGEPLTSDQLASFLVSHWGGGFDASSDVWYAMQRAASDEFGIGATIQKANEAQKIAGEAYYAQYGEALRAWQRAQYDATQQWFADRGISEVGVFRGFAWDRSEGLGFVPKGINWGEYGSAHREPIPGIGETRLPLNPMSSFTADPGTAAGFGGRYRDLSMVVGAKVPVGRILSTGQTGVGAKFESELVVLGSAPGDTVKYEAVAKDVAAYEAVAQPAAEAASAAGDMGLPALTYTLPEIDHEAEAAIIQQAQDVLASGGVASHEDILALGAPIHDYLDARIGPLSDWAAEANTIYSTLPADLNGAQIAWIAGDTSQHGGLTVQESLEQYQAAMRQETIRLLDQVRGVGITELDVAEGAPTALEDMLRQVENALPTDWLDASNANGEVTLLNETNRRGYYRSDSQSTAGTIGLRNNADTTPGQLYTATMHELGHRMQDSVDGLWQAEQTFYEARTAGEAWTRLPDDLRVLGRTKEDRFASPYLGKDPIRVVRGGGLPDTYHYELFSSGLEWVLGTDYRGAWLLSKDEEYHQWMLGLMFGAKGGVA